MLIPRRIELAAMAPMRLAVKAGRLALKSPLNPIANTDYGKSLIAFADVFESTTRYYGKPNGASTA
ncbi:MAG: hypothetical protein R3B98_00355 [Hyphomonas sp.]